MNFQLETSPFARSTISNYSRREVMWNVLEPGDPYDIRKSMIAKMPGDKKIFMGDHLEIVCLLQSAEIERITEFLDDYKLKFRDIDRSKLDRHSYQMQIKELSLKLEEQQSIRAENAKLKDFVKKQNVQLESIKKDSREYRGIDEKSYEKISQLLRDNQYLQQANEHYKLQIQSFNAKFEAIEKGHIKEMEDLKLNISQYSKQSYEASINSIRFQNESQIKQMEFELNRAKESHQQRNNEILSLLEINKELQNQVTSLRMQEGNQAHFQRYIFDLENKLKFINQQNERLTISARDLSNKCEQLEFKWREVNSKSERLQLQLRERQLKLQSSMNQSFILKENIGRLQIKAKKADESSHYLNQYEQKINNLLRENQQLIAKVGNQGNLERKLREEIDRLANESSRFKLIENQNNNLKKASLENNNLQRNLAELQNLYTFSNKEIERLSNILRQKDQQLQQYRNILIENNNLKNHIREVQFGLAENYQFQINRIRLQYESRLNHQTAMTDNELQSRAQVYQREVEKLKEILKAKGQETARMRAQINEMEVKFNRSEVENSIKMKNQQSNIISLKRNNEEMTLKIRQMIEGERKLYEVQQNHIHLQKEYERLQTIIKNKEDETNFSKNKLKEIEVTGQRYEQEVRTKAVLLEKNIQNLKTQNEEYKKKTVDLTNELNRRSNQFIQQATKLKRQMALKNEEKIQIQTRLKQVFQENEQTKQFLKRSTLDGQELRKKIIELQGKLAILFNESSSTIRNLQSENENMKRYLYETKSSVNNIQLQTSRKVVNYELSLTQIKKENEDLRVFLKDQELKINNCTKQLETLNTLYKQKTQQTSFLEENHNRLGKEYEHLKAIFTEHQSAANARFANYQQTILTIIQESDQIKQQILQQNEYLKKIIVQRQTSLANIELQLNRRTTNFENNFKNLNRINQEQQKRLNDNDILIRSKMEDIIRLESTINTLNQQAEASRRRSAIYDVSSPSKSSADINQNLVIYEQTINKQNRQIDQLKLKLHEKRTECNFIMQSSESQLVNSKIENQRLITTINEVVAINESMKRQLEANYISRQNEINQIVQNYERKMQEIVQYCQQLERKISEFEYVMLSLKEAEEKVVVLSDNNHQITASLKQLDEENVYLKGQLQKHKTSESQIDESPKKEDLIKGLAQANAQLERLLAYLHSRQQELHRKYQKQISEQRENLTRLLDQKKSQFTKLEENFINIQEENQELKKDIQQNKNVIDNDELQRIFQEFAAKNGVFTQQYVRELKNQIENLKQQKLNITVNSKKNYVELQGLIDQFNTYRKSVQEQLKEHKENKQKIDYLEAESAKFEQDSTIMKQEIERLKSTIVQINTQSAQQKERYERQISNLINQRNVYNSSLQSQLEEMGRILINYKQQQQEHNSIKRKLSQVQVTLQNYSTNQQFSLREKQLQQSLLQKNEELRANEYRLNQFKQQIESLKLQKLALQRNGQTKSMIESNFSSLERSLISITKQRDSLYKIQTQNDAKFALLAQQYERINMLYKLANSELQNLKRTSSRTTQMRNHGHHFSFRANPNDLQSAKRHLEEYETSIHKLYAQFERLQRIIDDLKRENIILINKNTSQNNELIRLSRENRDLQDHSKAIQLRLSDETIFRQGGKALSMFVAQSSQAAVTNSRIREQNEGRDSIGSLPSFR